MDQPPFTVLLVGNYENDEQTSMLQFSASLADGLTREGVDVRTLRPQAWFGRLKRAPTGAGKWLGYLDKFLLFPRTLTREVQRLRHRAGRQVVVHICDHSNAHYTRYLRDVPHLVTCNDLLAIRSAAGEFPINPTRWTGRQLQQMILRGLRQARHVTCISEATRQDLLRLSGLPPGRTSVTYMGFNNDFHHVASAKARARVQHLLAAQGADHEAPPGTPFLLHVGSNAWYKNRAGAIRLLQALAARKPSHPQLIFAGKPLSPELRTQIEQAGLAGSVADLGPVSHEDLCALYSSAEFLLFPSLEEGFGWPIIEAQACGCRVATTGKAPMTEIGGAAAVYLDLARETEAAESLALLLDEEAGKRDERRAAGQQNVLRFSTAGMIAQYRSLYGAALAAPNN